MNIQKAWPLHDNVQDGPRAFGRWMTAARDVDLDDPYWRARYADGSISLTDPAPVIGVVTRPDGSPVKRGPDGLIHGDEIKWPEGFTPPPLILDSSEPAAELIEGVVGSALPSAQPEEK